MTSKLRAVAIDKQLKIEANIAEIMSDEINHSFQAMELVLIGLSDFIRSKGIENQRRLAAEFSTRQSNDVLRTRISALAFLDALTVIDETGRALADTRVWPVPFFNFSDREYFKALKSTAGEPTYLSPPLIGKIAGRPTLVLAHRLTNSAGEFLGTVNASSAQAYFSTRLSRIDVGADSLVSFILDDGTVMAQSPPPPFPDESPATGHPAKYDTKALFGLPISGGLIPGGVLDDTERYTAVRRIANYPASIVVSVATKTVDDEVRTTRMPILIASLVICAIIVIVTALWSRQLRRERRQSSLQYRQARTDMMTGLANRLRLVEWLEALEHDEEAPPFALYFIDLDYFKTINDTLGHDVGDKLLTAVAARLTGALGNDSRLARLGGDEFAIIRMEIDNEADALRFAGAIVSIIKRPFLIDGQQLSITNSIGGAISPRDGRDLVSLLKSADLALFKAKADGRGAARIFSAELASIAETRRKLHTDLEEAWSRQQFHIAYQPIFEAESHRLSGFEALLRWKHPERGEVPPDVFIPVAEETGLIVRLGAWVLQQACADAARWPQSLFVSINLSPIQFRDGAVEAQVYRALQGSGLPAERLELEITESTLLRKKREVQAILGNFRSSGIGVALDDFGTGYSSLRYLTDFKIDRIKIDRCFVEGLDRSSNHGIIQAILALASTLALRCTAEGVETEAQAAILSEAGCSHLQGYLLGRPLSPDHAFALACEANSYLEAS
ncbi:MAG: diguanylate cyclase/phosphodiesterase [Proteobacteria bacterium]|nr:diguanylate cyclase/phosphodiesterase [Pseudomonadota bacterium]